MAAIIPLDEEKEKAILRQVEFYFSDSNLPRDNFLKKIMQEREDRSVSLALICSFSRMRTHLGLGPTKLDMVPDEMVQAVAATLKKSSSLRVSEDNKRIGRISELPNAEEILKKVDSRTIAVSPLPYDVNIEVLESFFGQYGEVNSVRLVRHIADKRHFCGTALIEFSEEEDAEMLFEIGMDYAGVELEINPKKEFEAERERMKKDYERARSNKNASNASYPKGLIVAFKLKSMSTEGTDNEDEKSSECVGNDKEEKSAEDKLQESEQNTEEGNDKVAKSSTRESKGKNNSVVTREDLKLVFQKYGTVKYIDYQMGDESGHIRFQDPEAAVNALAIAMLGGQGGLVVKNFTAIVEALTGSAEKDYWNTVRVSQYRLRENRSNKGRSGSNNRGHRHFHGKYCSSTVSADTRADRVQKIR